MTERTQRRAAERKTRKAEQKRLRHLAQQLAQKSTAPEITELPTLPTRELKITAAPTQSAPPPNPVSEAQLAANQANAKLAHGPVTGEGKAISARNNFRHGLTQTDANPILLASESKEDHAQLLSEFQTEWRPATATERDLVDRLVTHSWLRRRALNLQKLFLCPEDGLITDEKQFNLYRRYEIQHERAFNKALSDLMRLRALRLREQNGFESQRRQNEKHEYQIRCLKNREKLQNIAELTAQAKLVLAQSKLAASGPAKESPKPAAAAIA